MTSDDSLHEADAAETEAKGASPTLKGKQTRPHRKVRLYPNLSFEEALFLANAIQKHGAGQDTRRLTLFDTLQRSPDSGPTRKLITASNQYGITTGGYNAEVLGLPSKGRQATDPAAANSAKMTAHIDLAIRDVAPFAAIYAKYQGNRLPTVQVLRDAALEAGVEQ